MNNIGLLSDNNLDKLKNSSIYNITIEDKQPKNLPSENTFMHTKTKQGEKKILEQISTTNPFLTCQSTIKNENIKAPISNFELQKELSKKSKLKSGNEFENINIINDSQYLFRDIETNINKNVINLKDYQIDINDNSNLLSKRNNTKILMQDTLTQNKKFLKKVNKENDFDVISKWGKNNNLLGGFNHENFDFSLIINPDKLKLNKPENDSMVIFNDDKPINKSILKEIDNNQLKESNLKISNFIFENTSPNGVNVNTSDLYIQNEKGESIKSDLGNFPNNTFFQMSSPKDSENSLNLNEKPIFSIHDFDKESPKDPKDQETIFIDHLKNKTHIYSPMNNHKSKYFCFNLKKRFLF